MTFKKDRLKKNVVLGSDNSFIKYFECEENELHAISTDDSGQRDREANRWVSEVDPFHLSATEQPLYNIDFVTFIFIFTLFYSCLYNPAFHH